jgi:hypothetical protein
MPVERTGAAAPRVGIKMILKATGPSYPQHKTDRHRNFGYTHTIPKTKQTDYCNKTHRRGDKKESSPVAKNA